MSMDTSMSSTYLFSRRNSYTPILDLKIGTILLLHFHNSEENCIINPYTTKRRHFPQIWDKIRHETLKINK